MKKNFVRVSFRKSIVHLRAARRAALELLRAIFFVLVSHAATDKNDCTHRVRNCILRIFGSGGSFQNLHIKVRRSTHCGKFSALFPLNSTSINEVLEASGMHCYGFIFELDPQSVGTGS